MNRHCRYLALYFKASGASLCFENYKYSIQVNKMKRLLLPAAVLHLGQSARAGWHGNLNFNHLNSVFSARSYFQVGPVKPALEHR